MAKKKAKAKFENDPIANKIVSKWDIIEKGDKVLDDLQNLETISFSPALDLALGGGIREGSCVNMSGDPKTGKTTSALYFAAKCQQLGKKVVYLNTEGRLTKENFTGIKGLDPSEITILQSTEKCPLVSAEMYLNSLEHYIKGEPGLVAIVDSVSNMVPSDELEGEIRSGVRNALPRLLSMFLKRISGDVQRNKVIVIFVLHNIANTGGSKWSPTKMADSGNMVQYQAGTNMVITHRGKWETTDGTNVGQVANWLIKTSSAGGIPNSTAASYIRYGIGIDETQEIFEIANELALVKQAGAWYTISIAIENRLDPVIKSVIEKYEVDPENLEEVQKLFKFQGGQKVLEFLTENEGLTNFMYQEVREMM